MSAASDAPPQGAPGVPARGTDRTDEMPAAPKAGEAPASPFLHSPAELEAILGERIVRARPLLADALTAVLEVGTASGARWVYKGYVGPSVEAQFYRQTRSALLPGCRCLLEEPGRTALLLEHIDAPMLSQTRPAEDVAVQLASELPQRFQEFEGDPPVVERLDSVESWRGLCARALERLRLLGQRRTIRAFPPSVLAEAARIAAEIDVAEVLQGEVGLIHSDLHADNVFALPGGGWKVIDWQAPRIGPLAVDAAFLLETLGYDPLPHVPALAVVLMNFLRIEGCASYLLKAGHDSNGQSERYLVFRVSTLLALECGGPERTGRKRSTPLCRCSPSPARGEGKDCMTKPSAAADTEGTQTGHRPPRMDTGTSRPVALSSVCSVTSVANTEGG